MKNHINQYQSINHQSIYMCEREREREREERERGHEVMPYGPMVFY